KYAIPDLSTPDGKRWNITSISATAIMWLRSRHEETKLQVKLDNLNSDYTQIATQYETASQQFKGYADNVAKLVEQSEAAERSISDARRNFKFKVSGEMTKKDTSELSKLIQKDQQKIVTIKEKVSKITPMKTSLQSEAKALKVKYVDMKSKRQFLDTEVRNLKKNLDVQSGAFHSILGSLVKALIQRKKLITD
ncbi:MAG: hypothetical protein GQ474_06740, partial [Sulfurimonas sp.]|nr:hypothetical protein [Sulfurimonas sp.]